MPIRSTERTLRRVMRKLMLTKRLDQITINEICERAEIGRRTFYRYYPDKYALFEDTYMQEYYRKLGIAEDLRPHEVYLKIAEQMYEEQEFFQHAITAKSQNGFWELIAKLVLPHALRLLTSDPYIDKAKKFYVEKDIEIVLHHFEEWILTGCRQTPKELVEYIRLCNALHGKWQYQLSMGHTPDSYTQDKFENNIW